MIFTSIRAPKVAGKFDRQSRGSMRVARKLIAVHGSIRAIIRLPDIRLSGNLCAWQLLLTNQLLDSSAVSASGRKKLFHLHALRGLAASLVVLAHSIETLAIRDLIADSYAGRLELCGYFGVATFFIISGFI
jgi:hypothetical protein